MREKGAKYADNLFKFIGIQIGVLIFGMFWFSSCSTLIYPVAFSVAFDFSPDIAKWQAELVGHIGSPCNATCSHTRNHIRLAIGILHR